MTSSTSSSKAAAALAVVAPVVLVGATLGLLGRAEVPAPGEAAGPHADVVNCLKETTRGGESVVLVGNSKSGTDIDHPRLAKALGGPIAKIGGPGSSAPLWYASLERCVFEAGHHPKLVIVYGAGGAMLRTTLDSENEALALAPYLGESEPVLEAKVFGGEPTSPFWQRVRTRKSGVVLALQHGVRDLVSGLFFAPPGADGLLAAGRAHAVPALDKVLGADAISDAVARPRGIPIAESEAGPTTARDTTIADTLIPDFVALAKANGSRIVFVHAPIATIKSDVYDKADPALIRDLVATLNASGAGFIDLTNRGIPDTAFGDGIHMNSAGRDLVTAALAEQLVAMNALEAETFAPAPLPRVPAKLRREGAHPPLPELGPLTRGPWACGWQVTVGLAGLSDTSLSQIGIGAVSPLLLLEDGAPLKAHATRDEFDVTCVGGFNHQNAIVKFSPTGGPADVASTRTYTTALSDAVPLHDPWGREAWWVYPGTTLHADATEGWSPAPDGFGIHVDAVVAIPGTAQATLSWGGATAPLLESGRVGSATVHGAAPDGPWNVEIASPPDGPWLLVRRIVAGTEAAPWHLVGTPDVGSKVDVFKGELAYAADPPAIGPLGKILPMKEGYWRIETTDLGAPDADVIYRNSGISGCSPVVLAQDGVPLPVANSLIRSTSEFGAWAHTAFGFIFNTTDGTSPLENGRAYTATLNPNRSCRTGRWIYPGDVARFTVPAPLLQRLARGASRLDMTAAAFGGTDPSAALTARVFVGDEEVFAGTVPLAGIDAAPPSWALPTVVPTTAPGVVVELSTSVGAPFTWLTALSLTEPALPAFPDATLPDAPAAAAAPDPAAPRGASGAAIAAPPSPEPTR